MFKPVNRHILVDLDQRTDEQKSLIVLPEDKDIEVLKKLQKQSLKNYLKSKKKMKISQKKLSLKK